MKIKLAVFGREDIIQLIRLYVKDKEHIEIVPFIYKNESGIINLIDRAIMCDAFVFTEHLPFLYVQEQATKKNVPIIQVAVDEYMFLTSLYQLRKKHNPALHNLSIDIPNQEVVHKVIQELGVDSQTIHTHAYGESHDIEEIVTHHEILWNQGKIEYVLTSIKEVKRRLETKNIPVENMVIPIGNIATSIEEAISIVTLNNSISTQVVSGIVNIRNKDEILYLHGESYIQEILGNIEQILETFKSDTDTSLFLNNEQQFIMFGTRGTLDYITSNYRSLPLRNHIEEAMPSDVTVDIAFGLGLHALEAEQHAQLALVACQKLDEHTCYIVNERKETIGPIGVKKQFNTATLYRDLIHKARLSNQLSYNFIGFIKNRNNEPFSSNDVAVHYNVTKRSAERTINKLLSGKVIKHVGEERPYVKGRPRKLFQIVQ